MHILVTYSKNVFETRCSVLSYLQKGFFFVVVIRRAIRFIFVGICFLVLSSFFVDLAFDHLEQFLVEFLGIKVGILKQGLFIN